ncbi:MAG TPA: hypothetical protein VGU61_06305 [Noviherbaspirillum sp.]|jgi:hypothetical protein|uniref:hypothetical protein n=1 Tax=Noviherbaspirillum sp. TaxID=1926288 RepID=UPI002DDD783B|nr:hypothetical protein [Noviherbaspirillum sp.]HEV2609860.1 hypothetical protein [Noviherbaspirillum sp.]
MSSINEFLKSDVQTLSVRDAYLGHAKNVQSGHHPELELTGNAFNVRFLPSGVFIESLWDEEDEPISIGLEDFIQVVSTWLPKR